MKRSILTVAVMLITLIFSTTALADYERTADNTVPAYHDANLTQRTGNERVDRGDRVTVHQETDRAYEVTYPTSHGSKRRWVPKNIFNQSNSNTVTLADGWYRIQPMHDLGRSADALGSQIGNGNNVHMWRNYDDALQQKFYLQNRGNGFFSLRSAYGNQLYVTVNGNGNGANLYTSSWNSSDSQLFRLVDAGNNSYHVFAKVGNNLNFDCAGAGKSDGNNVQLWTSENNDWHKWRFTKVDVGIASPRVSERQQQMADVALSMLGSTKYNNYCQRFVKEVGQKIGLQSGNAGSAFEACDMWRVSTNQNDIPVGATVYFKGLDPSRASYKYGHVGIHVGNGNIVHALSTVRQNTLSYLLQQYEYLGWGWQAGVDLR